MGRLSQQASAYLQQSVGATPAVLMSGKAGVASDARMRQIRYRSFMTPMLPPRLARARFIQPVGVAGSGPHG